MSRRATLRLLLLGLLLCWCGVFLRSENTEKSIVRALLLEQTPEQWNVALLYQFPEAAADSSDAAASVQLCAGTGKKRWSRPSLRRRSICLSGPATDCASFMPTVVFSPS